MNSLSHLQKVEVKENKNYLKMDVHTKRNLELVETLRLIRNFKIKTKKLFFDLVTW